MRLFNRDFQLNTLPRRLGDFAKAAVNIFVTFRNPMVVLWHYARSTNPPEGLVTTRSGYRITFSGHKHDLISAVVVFCKQDYGRVKPGSVYLDIGANIGLFAIYAASEGARTGYAYEANQQAFDCMVHNIECNGLIADIHPYHLAVTDRSGDYVSFPVNPSPYNRIRKPSIEAPSTENLGIEVQTISLDEIVNRTGGHVDLMKMDIEGAEYLVIPAAQLSTLLCIDEIRMEYHTGPLEALCECLQEAGFQIVRKKAEQRDCGIIWFRR
ncbi:MAG: FkbM family methyltransferase [Anaerolineales bacterium]|nr:MAG: FkbM family methyltransferase [Anaerolineales bacterium]